MSRNLLSISITATLLGGTALADVPSVAVDIAPVHSLVARVMDGVGEPSLIVQPGASPHEYNLRPSEAAALQEADLVFWIGEDLTPWMENAVETLAGGATVTTLLEADGTTLLDFREDALFEAHDHGDDEDHDDHGHEDHGDDHKDEHAHDDHDDHKDERAHDDHDDHAHDDHDDHKDEHGHDDHDHDKEDDHAHDDHGHEEHADHDDHDDHEGHAHGEHDPHAWLSPANASTWLNVIAAQLSAADPENAGKYFENAAAARAEMEALSAEIAETLEPVKGGSFIVFHDAYQYFENDFDFPASGAISIGDASDPSPARIAEIQARIRDEGIDCVLAEPQFNSGLIATVLEGTEANTGVIDPLSTELEPGPALYPQLLRNMANTLAECL
ncbi:zinc ABC transporter substrate-binding protein [Ruegeria sp. R13_0]|uniref:zinc ABC transporter substrate-binding protein n=1 Tax=Ruegeria sp. R13_0 TaxID=2821099 RepID=UPI001AD97D25|nr:zinc ABC transporter substrate-binding protein [Ruegeria sp. R13_0]MBO9434982.1 zinc ABC transporter substrate-binding protein [Ruegeria sp. R13_0]